VSSDLKKIASRFSIPLICASQFSRKAEGRQPTMADLKESGALEQDADVIISLWKDKQDDELNLNKDITMVRIDLLKNRQGQTFNNSDTHIFKVAFNKKLFVFNDLENEIPANNNQ
jgi:replicative DNA helicase